MSEQTGSRIAGANILPFFRDKPHRATPEPEPLPTAAQTVDDWRSLLLQQIRCDPRSTSP